MLGQVDIGFVPGLSPPTVSISLNPTSVDAGQPFTITVDGHSDVGLSAIWWFGDVATEGVSGTVDGVNYNSLYRVFWHDCAGVLDCSRSWTVTIDAPGSYTFGANSRDLIYQAILDAINAGEDPTTIPGYGEPHQASEGSGILYVTLENQAPTMAPMSDQTTNSGELFSLTAEATDPDDDQLMMSATRLPKGATFTDHRNGTGEFSWTPTLLQVGAYSVTFTASDGGLSDSKTIQIIVEPPPSLLDPIQNKHPARTKDSLR